MEWVKILHEWTVVKPLFWLYAYGPKGLGMWSGATNQTICARLAPAVSSEFWTHPETEEECAAMVRRDLDSWLVVVQVGVYFYFMFEFVRCVARHSARKLFGH